MASMNYELHQQSWIQPNWAAEAIGPQNMIPGGAKLDPAQFPTSDSFTVQATGAAAAGATTTIPVAALEEPIPANYILNFGGGKYATLNAAAKKNAISLSANLAVALTGTETAFYGGISGKRLVVAGTLVGRTYAERDTNVPFGPAIDTDEEVYLLAFDTVDAGANPDCELLRHGTLVRDHLLPGWAAISAALKTKIRTLYQTVRGPTDI